MKRILNFLIGTELAAMLFKRIEGGWAFKTPPFRRLFGLAMFYRLDDQKKTAIENAYMKMWRGGMLCIMPLVAVGLLLTDVFNANTYYELAYLAVSGVILGLGMNLWFTRQLRHELRDIVPIVERFNWIDQQASMLRAMTVSRTLVGLGLSLGLGYLVLSGARSGDVVMPLAITALVLFGASALFYAGVLVWKITTQATHQPQ